MGRLEIQKPVHSYGKPKTIRHWANDSQKVHGSRPEKIVIAKCPDRVEHSGPNNQVNDCFQPDGKISSNFLAQTYLSQQPGETTSAELLVFSAQFFWMLRQDHRDDFVLP
jgi:hypothetical protein